MGCWACRPRTAARARLAAPERVVSLIREDTQAIREMLEGQDGRPGSGIEQQLADHDHMLAELLRRILNPEAEARAPTSVQSLGDPLAIRSCASSSACSGAGLR